MIKQHFFFYRTGVLLLQYVVVDVVQWTVLEMLQQLTSESPIVGLFFFAPSICWLVIAFYLNVSKLIYWLVFILI